MYQGLGGIATPLVPLSQVSQSTVLIQDAPRDGIAIQTNVSATNTQTDDFFTFIVKFGHQITKVNVKVEEFRNGSRSSELH